MIFQLNIPLARNNDLNDLRAPKYPSARVRNDLGRRPLDPLTASVLLEAHLEFRLLDEPREGSLEPRPLRLPCFYTSTRDNG